MAIGNLVISYLITHSKRCLLTKAYKVSVIMSLTLNIVSTQHYYDYVLALSKLPFLEFSDL